MQTNQFTFNRFVQSLGSVFRRNDLQRSCEALTKKIDEILPEVHQLQRHFDANKPTSPAWNKCTKSFSLVVGSNDPLVSIDLALRNAARMSAVIDELSVALFQEEEATSAISYKKVGYVQVVTFCNFMADYALKLVGYLLGNELAAASKGEISVEDQFTKRDISYLSECESVFLALMKAFSKDNGKDVESLLKDLPEVSVSESSEASLTARGVKSMNYAGLQNLRIPDISVRYNPFYLFGTMIASYQVNSFKALEEEVRLVQMRRMLLVEKLAGKQNPKLEREIEYLTNRLQKLNAELADLKKDYDV